MDCLGLHPRNDSKLGINLRLIQTDQDLAAGCAHLSATCKYMAKLVADLQLPPLRRRGGGFESLVNIVIGQQLSIAAANTIEARLKAWAKDITPEKILRMREQSLRRCGLSGPKIKTLRAVAQAVKNGTLDFKFIQTAPVEEARAMLTSISGIGPWTADIYLLFCLGHSDAFAPGDLALQEAVRMMGAMRTRPDAAQLETYARRWSPWRGVAARLLWAHYGNVKNRNNKK